MRFTRHNDSLALDDFWNRVERDWRSAGSDRTPPAATPDAPADDLAATDPATTPAAPTPSTT